MGLLEEGEKEDKVAAIIRLAQSGNVPPQVRVIAQFREIITVRMQRGSILDIREDAQVSSFKAPGPSMGPEVELEDAEVLKRCLKRSSRVTNDDPSLSKPRGMT